MIPFGWIGNALLITGAWQLAKKHRYAFLITMLGNCCWLFEAMKLKRADWVFIEVVMMAVVARNYWKWGKDARSTVVVPDRAT